MRKLLTHLLALSVVRWSQQYIDQLRLAAEV
jgi:hypothetical protein